MSMQDTSFPSIWILFFFRNKNFVNCCTVRKKYWVFAAKLRISCHLLIYPHAPISSTISHSWAVLVLRSQKVERKLSKERQRPCWNVTAHILGTQQEQINSESMMVSTTKHTCSLGASKLHSFTDVMFFPTAVSRITKRGCVDWWYWTRSLGSAIL